MRTGMSGNTRFDVPPRVGTHLTLVWLLSVSLLGPASVLSDRTFVPIPIFATDPNARETYGALLAVIEDQDSAVRSLLAPYTSFNSLLGAGAGVYYQRYLNPDAGYTILASHSTENQADYFVRYLNLALAQRHYLLVGEAGYRNDRTACFFGLGAGSRGEDETNYTLREFGGMFTFGRWLTPTLVASLTERMRDVTIRRGVVDSLPFLRDAFVNVPGEDGGFVWAHRLALTYDSRNARDAPTRGGLVRLFLEGATDVLGSDASFLRYGLEGRFLWPLFENRLVTAVRGLVEWVDGSELPFFERSALGGAETLRGFGAGRFRDKGRFLLNAEERIKVWQFTYGKVRTDMDLAVFGDVGRVFHRFGDLGSGKVQAVGGGGVSDRGQDRRRLWQRRGGGVRRARLSLLTSAADVSDPYVRRLVPCFT